MIKTLSKIVSCVVKGNRQRQFFFTYTQQKAQLIRFPAYYYTQIKSFQDFEKEIKHQFSQIEFHKDSNIAIEKFQQIVLLIQNTNLNSQTIFNNQDHFQIFHTTLQEFFNVYIKVQLAGESTIKLDDQLLNPLINQEYINIVNIYNVKQSKIYIEQILKGFKILSEILRDGNTMSEERLQELANSGLLVYQEQVNSNIMCNYIKDTLQRMSTMVLPNFCFLISKIWLERNKNDKFKRYAFLGLTQAKQYTNFIFNSIKTLDQVQQSQVFKILLGYPDYLVNFYDVMFNKIQKNTGQEFLISYLKETKELIQQISIFRVTETTLLHQIRLAEYLINLKEYDQALQILKFVYGERHQIQIKPAIYYLLSQLIQCIEKTKDSKFDQNQIIRELGDLQNVDQIIQHDFNKFYDQKVNGNHDLMFEQLDRIATVFDKHCELVAQNEKTKFQSQKKLLNVFPLIDILTFDKETQSTLQYSLRIYESLKKVKNVKLSIDEQEFKKQSYYQPLYLLECEYNQIYPKDLINNLKQIYSDIQHQKKLQIDFFQMIISLFHQQFFKGNKNICKELLNIAEQYLQAEDSKEFDEAKRIIKIQKELIDRNMGE